MRWIWIVLMGWLCVYNACVCQNRESGAEKRRANHEGAQAERDELG